MNKDKVIIERLTREYDALQNDIIRQRLAIRKKMQEIKEATEELIEMERVYNDDLIYLETLGGFLYG